MQFYYTNAKILLIKDFLFNCSILNNRQELIHFVLLILLKILYSIDNETSQIIFCQIIQRIFLVIYFQ